jgi:DNA-binding HxlR family transcriptional regulator
MTSDSAVQDPVKDQSASTGADIPQTKSPVRSIPIDGRLDSRKNLRKEPRRLEELPAELQAIFDENRSNKSTLEVLEGKYVLRMLFYLDDMSPVLKTDIYNDISRSSGMSDKLDDLRQLGLLEMYSTSKANACVVAITERGRTIVRLLKAAVKVIDEEPDEENSS